MGLGLEIAPSGVAAFPSSMIALARAITSCRPVNTTPPIVFSQRDFSRRTWSEITGDIWEIFGDIRDFSRRTWSRLGLGSGLGLGARARATARARARARARAWAKGR